MLRLIKFSTLLFGAQAVVLAAEVFPEADLEEAVAVVGRI